MINNFALIIGAMKCGTTSLFQYLADHPQVCPCEPRKEPNFFEKDSNYSKGFDWYRSLWSYDPKIHKIALEGSTNYTKMRTSEVVDRISRAQSDFNVDFRFIYIMRDPIERIESQYTNGLRAEWGKTMKRLDQGFDERLIEISKYAKQISQYYQAFSHDQILLLESNDLKSNTLTVLESVCNFLDLDSSYQFPHASQEHHSNKGKIIDSSFWPVIEPVAKLIPLRPRTALRRKMGRTIEGNIKLSLEQRNFVLNELQDDLKTLQHKYGVDVSRWGIDV